MADVVKQTVKGVGNGNAGGGLRTEAVDSCGHDHIRNGIKAHLQTGGNADTEDLRKLRTIETNVLDV